jgi:tetratricopeptide (TPR) repeat protein
MTTTFKLTYVICGASLLLAAGCARSPQAKEARFMKRGQELMAKKDFTRAILEFRNAAQAMPHDAEPYYNLGLAYLQIRDVAGAAKSLNQARHWNPKHAGATLKLAEIMNATGNKKLIAEAATQIEALLTASPGNAEAIDTLATAEFELGNRDQAATRLEDALRKFPARLESSVILARIKLQQKDLPAAETVLQQARANAPQSAAAALALGQLYLLAREPEKAEVEVRAALQLEPRNPGALLALGSIQFAAKRLEEAGQTYTRLSALPGTAFRPMHSLFLYQTGQKAACLAELQKLFRQDPEDRAIRSRLVSLNLEMGKTQEAQDLLAAVLKQNPRDAEALQQRGAINLKAGRFTQAQDDMQKVLQLQPDSAEAHLTLAGVYQAAGRPKLEDEELNSALKLRPELLEARVRRARNYILAHQPKPALDLLDQTPAAQKSSAGVAIQRNWALLAAANVEEARRQLDRELSARRLPELVLQNAVLKLRQHDYSGARKDAEEVLQASPEDVRAARIVVDSFVAQKEHAKAEARLAQIAANRPKSAALQDLLGQWYEDAGRLEDARKAFEAAKAAEPQSHAADLSLAEIDQRQNRTDAARQRLAALTAGAAADPTAIRAALMLGNLEDGAGNRTAAMARYRAVLAADDSNIYALNNLAYDLALDDPDQALKLAQRAGELAPDNPSVQDTLGYVYHRKGIEAKALIYLQTAAAKEPTARRQFHLAMCYLKTGQKDLGQKTMLTALAKEPSLATTERGW